MIVIKKRSIVIVSVLILCVITFFVCFGALTKNTSNNVQADRICIVLDAGHGGIDCGVVGVETKVKESELNLLIVKKLERVLTDAGFKVVLTRNTSAGLYGVASKNLKRKDMLKRKEIINSSNADMVLSIHMNKYSMPSRRGAQVFFKVSDENGKNLATSIQGQLNELNNDIKGYSALSGDYYILNCSNIPSVIVECGFLSNSSDEKKLLDEEYQDSLVFTIYKGIVKYLTA